MVLLVLIEALALVLCCSGEIGCRTDENAGWQLCIQPFSSMFMKVKLQLPILNSVENIPNLFINTVQRKCKEF